MSGSKGASYPVLPVKVAFQILSARIAVERFPCNILQRSDGTHFQK